MYQPRMIVSGGQTGADRGALLAAKDLGIATGGWMPHGLMCEDDQGKSVQEEFGLSESDGDYAKRDRQNVDMSDCVLAFLLTRTMTGRGTTRTVRYALTQNQVFEQFEKQEKDVIIVWDIGGQGQMDDAIQIVRTHLQQWRPSTLMISGPCSSTDPLIGEHVKIFISNVLKY